MKVKIQIVLLAFSLNFLNTRNIFSMLEQTRKPVTKFKTWKSFADVKNFAQNLISFPDAFLKDDSLGIFLEQTTMQKNNSIPLTTTATILKTFPQFLSQENTSKDLSDIWKAIKEKKINLHENKIIANDFLKTYTDFDVLKDLLEYTTKILDMQCNQIHKEGTKFFTKAIPIFDENTVIHAMGDCHGGFHSLVEFLNSVFYSENQNEECPFEDNSFKLKEKYKNHHWVVCGDFTDSGRDSTEVVRLLCEVLKNNPNNFHIIRGSHEDRGMNDEYGFREELIQKYDKKSAQFLQKKLDNFYRALPDGIWFVYENGNVIPYFHGCIDYNDQGIVNLLESSLENKKIMYKSITTTANEHGKLPNAWNDVNINKNAISDCKTKLRPTYILNFIQSIYFLSNNKLRIQQINRCHQHDISGFTNSHGDSLMPIFFKSFGICELWDNEISIINILPPAPSSSFGVPFYYKGKSWVVEPDENNKNILKSAYPGIVRHMTGCTYINKNNKNELIHDYVELPNKYLSDSILDTHTKILSDLSSLIEIEHDRDQKENMKLIMKIAYEQKNRMKIKDSNDVIKNPRTENPIIRYSKSLGKKEFDAILEFMRMPNPNKPLIDSLYIPDTEPEKINLFEQGKIDKIQGENIPQKEKKKADNRRFWQKHPYITGLGIVSSLSALIYFLISKKYPDYFKK